MKINRQFGKHTIKANEILVEERHFFIVKDNYPVSPGHMLIISKRSKPDFFELSHSERMELMWMINTAKDAAKKLLFPKKPTGWNIGMNCGESAGQTVMHFHCHVIPRFDGDMEDPRGGIRHCIKGKGYY